MALEKIVIGVDGVGGDSIEVRQGRAVVEKPVVERICLATVNVAKKHPDVKFIIAGDMPEIIGYVGGQGENIKVFGCKKTRSANKLADMLKAGAINGFYTMGNTRDVDFAVAGIIGVPQEIRDIFPDIRIPPLVVRAPKYPSVERTDSWYILDAGAVPEYSRPEQFAALAHLGSIYSIIMGRANPRVGLVNMGKEANKGTPSLQDAHKVLEALNREEIISFIGNVEPFTCMNDREKGSYKPRPVDVAVCSGDIGNYMIKAISAGITLPLEHFKIAVETKVRGKVGGYCFKPEFEKIKEVYQKCAGAIFLGTNIVKDHGSTEFPEYGLEKCVMHVKDNINDRFKIQLRESKPRFDAAYARLPQIPMRQRED
jgi:fatty acid/phospholipid biosynthesis enzyme